MAGERRHAAGVDGPAIPRVDRTRYVGPRTLDPRERHAVTGTALGDPHPDFQHGPAALVAKTVGQIRVLAAVTAALEQLRVADARKGDLDQHLSWFQGRDVQLGEHHRPPDLFQHCRNVFIALVSLHE